MVKKNRIWTKIAHSNNLKVNQNYNLTCDPDQKYNFGVNTLYIPPKFMITCQSAIRVHFQIVWMRNFGPNSKLWTYFTRKLPFTNKKGKFSLFMVPLKLLLFAESLLSYPTLILFFRAWCPGLGKQWMDNKSSLFIPRQNQFIFCHGLLSR